MGKPSAVYNTTHHDHDRPCPVVECMLDQLCSAKPLLFYCNTMSASFLADQRKIIFYKQTMCSGNIVLNTICRLYHNDIRKICSSYNVTYHSSIAHIKQTMWYHFMRLIPN